LSRLPPGKRLAFDSLQRDDHSRSLIRQCADADGDLHAPHDDGGRRSYIERQPLQVLVRDNNIEQALRVLKKKMQREGVFREMKQRRSYEKPSERKTREKSEAIRRARKLARKKAQREGLIPDARKKKLLDAKKPGQRPAFPRAS